MPTFLYLSDLIVRINQDFVKQIIAFSILFCLVFLNVPRGLVHDCDHNSSIHHDSSDHDTSDHDDSSHSDSENQLSFEQDDCFTCEFQLDIAPTPFALSLKLADQHYAQFVETKLNLYASSEFDLFSLRGPPII